MARSTSSVYSASSRRSDSSASTTTKPLTDGELQAIASGVGKNAVKTFGSLKQMCRTIPTNDRGGVSRQTLRGIFKENGSSTKAADQLFDRVDVSNEGFIDSATLKDMMESPNRSGNGSPRKDMDDGGVARSMMQNQGGYPDGREGVGRSIMQNQGGYPDAGSSPGSSPKTRSPKKKERVVDATILIKSGTGNKSMEDLIDVDNHASMHAKGLPSRGASLGGMQNAYSAGGKQPAMHADLLKAPRNDEELLKQDLKNDDRFQAPTRNTHQVIKKPKAVATSDGGSPKKVMGMTELNLWMNNLGKSCSQKHGSIQAAFRAWDIERDGHIDRDEFRCLLQKKGIENEVADQVFDAIDDKGEDEINFRSFYENFGHFIHPGNQRPSAGQNVKTMSACHEKNSPERTAKKAHSLEQDKELNHMVKAISCSAERKHGSVRKAFSNMSAHSSTLVERHDVRRLFRNYGFNGDAADRLFDCLDVDGHGAVPTLEFRSHFAKHIEAGDSSCKLWAQKTHDPNAFDGRTSYQHFAEARDLS